MSHPAPLPPRCGAFCVGCEICCDLVNELDLTVKSKKAPGKLGGRKTRKNDTQISHDDKCSQERGKCSGKTCCRNAICDSNTYRTACTCFRKRAARHARCKSEKLHYMALCCIGKLACRQRSISPQRRRGCHCAANRCW